MVKLKNSSSGSPEHIKLLEAIDLMDVNPFENNSSSGGASRGNSIFGGQMSEYEDPNRPVRLTANYDYAASSVAGDENYISKFIQEEAANKRDSGFLTRIQGRISSFHSYINPTERANYHRSLSKHLMSRELPQLPMAQFLLFFFGNLFTQYKISEKEAGFETLYKYNVFTRTIQIERLFMAFFLIMNFGRGFYNYVSSNDQLHLFLRFLPQVLLCASYLVLSTFKSFYHYQKMFLCIIWLMYGLFDTFASTYMMKSPGNSSLYTVLAVIFFLESMDFFQRLVLAILLCMISFMMTNAFCVQYSQQTDSSFENLNFNLTEIGLKFCGAEEFVHYSFQTDNYHPPLPDEPEFNKSYEGSELLDFMKGSIRDTGYEAILNVQTMTIKDSIYNFLILFGSAIPHQAIRWGSPTARVTHGSDATLDRDPTPCPWVELAAPVSST